MAKLLKDFSTYPSCFVCGYKNTGAYPLFIHYTGQSGPYFPFLETHEPPDGAKLPSKCGQVLSCFVCYSFLTQQWESYEKSKVPLVKRIYWLKRVDSLPYAGIEMGVQSEYASQVFGLNSESLGIADDLKKCPILPKQEYFMPKGKAVTLATEKDHNASASQKNLKGLAIQDEALDLTIEKGSKKKVKYNFMSDTSHSKRPVDNNNDVLDLSMPDTNALTEVCYVCGSHFEKGTLNDIYGTEETNNGSPNFPCLSLYHSRPSGSRPMEAGGRLLSCKSCLQHLLSQWKCFEQFNIPGKARRYFLHKGLVDVSDTNFICQKCQLVNPQDLVHIVIYEHKKKPESYCNISDIAINMLKSVSACNFENGEGFVCVKCIPSLNLSSIILSSAVSHIVKVKKEKLVCQPQTSRVINLHHTSKESYLNIKHDENLVVCCLCHKKCSQSQSQTLVTEPLEAGSMGMFFPFLRHLPSSNCDKTAAVQSCLACFAHLESQWRAFQEDSIPLDQRHFALRPSSHLSSPPPISNSSSSSSSSGLSLKRQRPLRRRVQQKHVKTASPNADETLCLPLLTTQRAIDISVECFICGHKSQAGHTYAARSRLSTNDASAVVGGSAMIFPFLERHQSPNIGTRVDGDVYMLCMVCFHSLVAQWHRFERIRAPPHSRVYDISKFPCYVCATKTYRKRLCLLSVKTFPFLHEHNAPPCALVVSGGREVVICRDCYVSLKHQFTDMERLRVPLENRFYNWIQKPPPKPPISPKTQQEIGDAETAEQRRQ